MLTGGEVRTATQSPIVHLQIIGEPFQRISMNIIGPPTTLMLMVIKYATVYPEAIALSSIRAEKVAGARLIIFSRVGFAY